MTLAAISTEINQARIRLAEIQLADCQLFADAYARLGRAQQAIEAGDYAACEKWLRRAESTEYEVTGAVECSGAALQLLLQSL